MDIMRQLIPHSRSGYTESALTRLLYDAWDEQTLCSCRPQNWMAL